MKELEGESTQNCNICQYRKRKGSQYKGVLIRDPDFYGKCCRPEGLCERRNINDGPAIEEEENDMILDAMEPKTQEKKRRDPDHKQMNLF